MIIVDVKVPALEKVYNFSMDERARVGDLIEEIVQLVLQKEGVQFSGVLEEMTLGSVDKGIQCSPNHSLRDYAVGSGEELILV